MSKLAESHSEMEFYFIHFGPIRSCGGSHLDPVIKDTAGFHSKEIAVALACVLDIRISFIYTSSVR